MSRTASQMSANNPAFSSLNETSMPSHSTSLNKNLFVIKNEPMDSVTSHIEKTIASNIDPNISSHSVEINETTNLTVSLDNTANDIDDDTSMNVDQIVSLASHSTARKDEPCTP